ncbi:MAG: HAD family hydrolase [Proteobacteria bacterium]|nr:HAD family hydrolase [Pseudomonadota bacterium]MBU4469538.1 HAD family hydrolase [Pseudomonadota bacterium]
MPKAAFLDRDGIINMDTGYVYKKEDFLFVPGIFNLCRVLIEKDYRIILITNQSGIGRGIFTLEDFNRLNQWMIKQFQEKGVSILKVFFCPHHPTEARGEYKTVCSCRKPAPGMIFQAREEFRINLNESILIGDKPSDILAGINAGIPDNYLINPHTFNAEELNPCKRFSNLDGMLKQLKAVMSDE